MVFVFLRSFATFDMFALCDINSDYHTPKDSNMDHIPFLKSPNPQTDSRLMQLPFELRNTILRRLLRAPGRIQRPSLTWPAKYTEDELIAQFELSSQLLACCQILLARGAALLYREKVLTVDIRPYRLYLGLRILRHGALFPLHYHDDESPTIEQGLTGFGKDENPEIVEDPDSAIQSVIEVASRFQKIYLDVHYHGSQELLRVARALHKLLQNKDVSATLRKTAWTPFTCEHSLTQDQLIREIDTLKYLRCKMLTLTAKDLKGKNLPEAAFTSLHHLIISQEPVHDISLTYRRLPFHKLPSLAGRSFKDRWGRDVKALEVAARTADNATFDALKLKLCEESRKWLQVWTEERYAAIVMTNAELLRELDEA